MCGYVLGQSTACTFGGLISLSAVGRSAAYPADNLKSVSEYTAEFDMTPEQALEQVVGAISGLKGVSLERSPSNTLQIRKKKIPKWAIVVAIIFGLALWPLLFLLVRANRHQAWVRAEANRGGGTTLTFTPAPKPDAEVSAALARAVNQYSVQLVGNRDSSSSQEVFGAAQEGRAAANPEMRVPPPESDDKPPRPYKGDPTRGFRLPKEPDS